MGIFRRLRRDPSPAELGATPGESPVVMPPQPSVPPAIQRAPLDPAGAGSGQGRTSGGSIARGMGSPSPGFERVTGRYDAYLGAFSDASALDNDPLRGRTASHHQGQHWRNYHIEPRRQWGVQPFFSGAHGRYRRANAGVRGAAMGAHVGHASGGMIPTGGGPYPVVAREKPLPWDQGVLRSLG